MYNECRHIHTSGQRCQSPALKQQDFCYFHQTSRHRRTSRGSGQPSAVIHLLPPVDDADAIQLALSDIILALAANRIDPRRAQILIYGLQVASQNNKQRPADRKLPTVREAHRGEDGSFLAPSQQQPDPEDLPKTERFSLFKMLMESAEKQAQQAEESQQPKEIPAADEAAVSPALAQQKAGESATLPQIHAAVDPQVHGPWDPSTTLHPQRCRSSRKDAVLKSAHTFHLTTLRSKDYVPGYSGTGSPRNTLPEQALARMAPSAMKGVL